MFNIKTINLIFQKVITIFTIGSELIITSKEGIIFIIIILSLIILLIIYFLKNNSTKQVLLKTLQDNQLLNSNIEELEKVNLDLKEEKKQLQVRFDELLVSNEKLKKLAYFDSLTQLPNRLATSELLDSIMLTLRNDETIGVLYLNIDNFKQINTQLGYSYGDELLIDVAHRLQQVIDENDFLARISGDEFVILTQNINDTSEYDDQLKRILNVFSYPFVLSTEERFISVSIGVAIAPKDGKTTSALLKNANVAMKAGKETGKNVYIYFKEEMNEKITDMIQIQSDLRNGFENNEFILFYEPIVWLKENKIVGFEALICWNHPTMGILYPSDFIGYAEETGIIAPIGIWAFKAACSQMKDWEEKGHTNIKLSYNVSMLEFKDPEFISIIWDIVSKSGIRPENLTLEITEATALDNIEYTISTINKLKELGINFCLDKFGTNYSSIRYLKKLLIKNIKIDKILTKFAIESVDEQRIVEAIINLLKTFKFGVIAEGVDYKEQEEFLRNANCDKAQGALYSDPIPGEQTFELIKLGYKRSGSEEDIQ